jgi:hypothetical protein
MSSKTTCLEFRNFMDLSTGIAIEESSRKELLEHCNGCEKCREELEILKSLSGPGWISPENLCVVEKSLEEGGPTIVEVLLSLVPEKVSPRLLTTSVIAFVVAVLFLFF